MSDEELLQLAEDKLNASRKAEDFTAAKEMAHESMAASLLVIARNSIPIVDYSIKPVFPKPNKTEPFKKGF